MNVAGIKASQRKKGSWMESFHLAMFHEGGLTWQKKALDFVAAGVHVPRSMHV